MALTLALCRQCLPDGGRRPPSGSDPSEYRSGRSDAAAELESQTQERTTRYIEDSSQALCSSMRGNPNQRPVDHKRFSGSLNRRDHWIRFGQRSRKRLFNYLLSPLLLALRIVIKGALLS